MAPVWKRQRANRNSRFTPRIIRRSSPERQELARHEEAKAEQRRLFRRAACLRGEHDGHTSSHCPNIRRRPRHNNEHITVPVPPVTQEQSWSMQTQEKSKWPIFPVYHCPGMSAIDRETHGAEEDYKYPTPGIEFADLRACLTILLRCLRENSVADIRERGYDTVIKNWCSIEEIADIAMGQIEREVLDLQGKALSPEILIQAQERQFERTETWPQVGGYVDLIVDRRHPKYMRFYVGQSFRLPQRLSIEHAKKIRNGSIRYLHYFVLARGHGSRSARFLRLWSTANDENNPNEQRAELLQNVLEMTFCCVFDSLPAEILAPFFGARSYSNLGLNTMSPLLQGIDLPAVIRAKYSEYHRTSPDPDISTYVEIRKARNAERRREQQQGAILLKREYRQAIVEMAKELGLDPDSFSLFATPSVSSDTHTIEADLEAAEKTLSASGTNTAFCRPRGTYKALIGVVLTSELLEIEYDGHKFQPLRDVELTEQQSLIWTTSFEEVGSGPSRFSPGSDEERHCRSLNRSLILNSGLRVVILCGLRAVTDIQQAFDHALPKQLHLSHPRHLILGQNRHEVRFLSSGQTIDKIFLACPEPIITSYLKDISLSNQCFTAALVAQLHFEKQGAPPLEASSLSSVFRDWLLYRGFNDDDILALERTAPSLTKGIQMVRHILSKLATRGLSRNRKPAGEGDDVVRGERSKSTLEGYQEVKELFLPIYQRRLDSITGLNEALGRTSRTTDSTSLDSSEENMDKNLSASLWDALPEVDGALLEDDDVLLEHDEESMQKHPLALLWHKLPGVDEDEQLSEPDDDATSQDDDDALSEADNDALSDADDEEHNFSQRGHSYSKSYKKFHDMLTASGTEMRAKSRPHQTDRCTIDVHQKLVTFSIRAEEGVFFGERPKFAIRAHLNKKAPHPNCVLGKIPELVSTDPSQRLALEYRLINDGNGGPDDDSNIWHFVKLKNRATGGAGTMEGRIFRANVLVDLLEGKTVNDLIAEGVERREVGKWMKVQKKTAKRGRS
ncbi:hypothetical protein NM208_g4290 [Fusarium decemcellulare]|uniref:Uncharacterized protein n=1 Tax=Fusarium decemcellulare TaxID=57161 RepID=A0ACC1SLG5_9HYPO|nr:hypothetical protein NM208_g4290 [Fusarium decemcellulare]